jgi:hypothetical protein
VKPALGVNKLAIKIINQKAASQRLEIKSSQEAETKQQHLQQKVWVRDATHDALVSDSYSPVFSVIHREVVNVKVVPKWIPPFYG